MVNEQLHSVDGNFFLTNLRVTNMVKSWGFHHQNSIFLEDISSVQITLKSQVAYLVLGMIGLMAGTGMLNNNEDQAIIAFVVAMFFLLLWAFSKTRILAIHPNGGRPIELQADKFDKKQLERLWNRVQQAKANRVAAMAS